MIITLRAELTQAAVLTSIDVVQDSPPNSNV